MEIDIVPLNLNYCKDMAFILSTDEKLHKALRSSSPIETITGEEYYNGCRSWENRKNGHNFIILNDGNPIGSISYHRMTEDTAGCGYWLRSDLWGIGYGTQVFSRFLTMIKEAGFTYVTANIIKENEASWRLWKRYTENIQDTGDRYTPLIKLT